MPRYACANVYFLIFYFVLFLLFFGAIHNFTDVSSIWTHARFAQASISACMCTFTAKQYCIFRLSMSVFDRLQTAYVRRMRERQKERKYNWKWLLWKVIIGEMIFWSSEWRRFITYLWITKFIYLMRFECVMVGHVDIFIIWVFRFRHQFTDSNVKMDPIFYSPANGIPTNLPSESKLATYMVISRNILLHSLLFSLLWDFILIMCTLFCYCFRFGCGIPTFLSWFHLLCHLLLVRTCRVVKRTLLQHMVFRPAYRKLHSNESR